MMLPRFFEAFIAVLSCYTPASDHRSHVARTGNVAAENGQVELRLDPAFACAKSWR